MTIYLRKATEKDLARIMEIIEAARHFLAAKKIPQWQNGEGPNKEVLAEDIREKNCYVLVNNLSVIGVGILSIGAESAYTRIKNGCWQNEHTNYAVIHRVAVDSAYQGQGFATNLLSFLVTAARLLEITDIRIDTHPKNKSMQSLIKKMGFSYQGDIQLAVQDGERRGYQLILT